MSHRNFSKIIIGICILIIIVPNCSNEIKQGIEESDNWKSLFYTIPAFCWLKITFFKPIYAILVYVSILFGFVSYFYGSSAGGHVNKKKLLRAIGIATTVGILGRSFIVFLQIILYKIITYIIPGEPEQEILIAGTISEVIIYVLWIMFIAGIAVFIYETLVVTAKEARPY